MKKNYLILLFTLIIFGARAQNYASFNDPRTWGKNGTPVFDRVKLDVDLEGLLAKVSLTMEVSARGYQYTEQDSLEVILDFVLPDGAAITNSYLWVEGEKMEAFHLARNVATDIYEGIVQRRRDPLLLVKNYYGYQARIYPMKGDEVRKFQIDYVCPLSFLKQELSLPLPAGFILSGSELASGVDIEIRSMADSLNPVLNLKDKSISISTEETLNISESEISNDLAIVFKSINDKNVFFGTYSTGAEKYFELLFSPKELLDIDISRRFFIILDYDSAATQISKQEALYNLIAGSREILSEEDELRIVYNGASGNTEYTNWFKVEDIVEYFPAPYQIGDTSMIEELLVKSLELNPDQKITNYLVVSSSKKHYNPQRSWEGYSKGQKFAASLKVKFPINIIGFSNKQFYYEPYSYYRSFEYNSFLSGISSYTKGSYNYLRYYQATLKDLVTTMVRKFEYKFDSFQVYTVLDDGYTYSTMEVGKTEIREPQYYPIFMDNILLRTTGIRDVNISDNYLIVGKFKGTLPMEVHISAETGGEVYFKKIILNEAQYNSSHTRVLWRSQFINELDKNFYNLSQSDLVFLQQKSLEYHILSRNTAFLSLEPGMNPEDFVLDGDESNAVENIFMTDFITSNKKPKNVNDLEILVFPNPATEYCKIGGAEGVDYITILTGEGMKVGEYYPDSIDENGINVSDLDPGLYIINIYWKDEVLSKKLIKK